MNLTSTLVRFVVMPATLLLAGVSISQPQSVAMPEKTRDNLMLVVRETIGANKLDEVLTPTGKATVKLSDGREIEMEMATWEFIGDTHIRFAFDGPQMMLDATPQDLAKLGVGNVDDALALAVSNIKRVYGEPSAAPWVGGVMEVQGKSPDLDSSYFLDREYWRALLRSHSEGLVVGVPKRGGLLYAPASDGKAVDGLKRGVARLHSTSGRLRVSSALYLFKDDKWSVFQAAIKQ